MRPHIREILVNDKIDPVLQGVVTGSGDLWLTAQDDVDVIIIFDEVLYVEEVYIQFWALSYADKIVLYFERIAAGAQSCWNRVGEPVIVSDGVNREVKYAGMNFLTSKIRLRLSGGHLDTFYRRYMLGIKQLIASTKFLGLDKPDISDHKTETAAPLHPGSNETRSTMRRRDPLFVFPSSREVLRALYQNRRSPWRILSLQSRHAERIRERGLIEDPVGKHVLIRYTSPTSVSVPSRSEALERLRIN